MTDHLTKAQRSEVMGRVRGRDTTPEQTVRTLVRRLGLRYRSHDRSLPGVPDIVIPAASTVILVHGCFWHRHSCARGESRPQTRAEFWENKFTENVRRDRRTARALRRLGWSVIVVWECQTKPTNRERLECRLRRFLIRDARKESRNL